MTALESLLARSRFGMKPGLDAIREICHRLGDPQLELGKVVHVAGTNGKGQTCAMLDHALRSAGFSVGRYTSPHLLKVNERFFFNGRMVDDETLERAASRVEEVLTGLEATYFEALTATAFLVFRELKCDYAILETGLGGRLDATNVCSPVLTVITKVGLDHCDWLGDTVEAIAREKAGIRKPGVALLLGENDDRVRETIKADFEVKCDGDFVEQNRALAMKALELLGVKGKLPADFDWGGAVWPGRTEQIGRFLVDGAHNPPGAEALVAWLNKNRPGAEYSLVFGACGDKNVDAVLEILRPVATRAYAVKTRNPRSLEAEELAGKMRAHGFEAQAWRTEKLEEIPGPVLVCGSLFLAGEALEVLGAYPWGEIRNDPWEKLK